MTEKPQSGVKSVVFALHMLEYITKQQRSVGISELAREFDAPKSRIHRHIVTLLSAGYLIRDESTERYSISARLLALAQAAGDSFELAAAARRVARDLRDDLGHAVAVGQVESEGVRILLMMPTKSNIEIAVKSGSLLAYHSSAQGKVALAFGDPTLLDETLSRPMERTTPYTITSEKRLREEVAAVRRQGWAVAPNEAMVGLNALAAPVFDALGGFVGTIAMTDSIQFITETPTPLQIEKLQEAASKVSGNLGSRD